LNQYDTGQKGGNKPQGGFCLPKTFCLAGALISVDAASLIVLRAKGRRLVPWRHRFFWDPLRGCHQRNNEFMSRFGLDRKNPFARLRECAVHHILNESIVSSAQPMAPESRSMRGAGVFEEADFG
jgi:hypothetical protein